MPRSEARLIWGDSGTAQPFTEPTDARRRRRLSASRQKIECRGATAAVLLQHAPAGVAEDIPQNERGDDRIVQRPSDRA